MKRRMLALVIGAALTALTAETAAATMFLDDQAREYGCSANDERVWADLAHVLFNVKEFVLVE